MPDSKPAVIELKRGETRWIPIVYRTQRAKLGLTPDPEHHDGPSVCAIAQVTHRGSTSTLGTFPLFDDPVRDAALAERDRCKQTLTTAIAAKCESLGIWGDQRLALLSALDALDGPDAPDEPVGEYERGVQDSIATLERLREGITENSHTPITFSARRDAYGYAARLLWESLLQPESRDDP